ncbi:hypothetical protein LY78DRAFT_245464 [Colletotrichum sublineola]|nr:hypothetical protein LY78DRAFT_245464 [Colletotrichum sublineola]
MDKLVLFLSLVTLAMVFPSYCSSVSFPCQVKRFVDFRIGKSLVKGIFSNSEQRRTGLECSVRGPRGGPKEGTKSQVQAYPKAGLAYWCVADVESAVGHSSKGRYQIDRECRQRKVPRALHLKRFIVLR